MIELLGIVKNKLSHQMIKQLLNLVIAKYRDFQCLADNNNNFIVHQKTRYIGVTRIYVKVENIYAYI